RPCPEGNGLLPKCNKCRFASGQGEFCGFVVGSRQMPAAGDHGVNAALRHHKETGNSPKDWIASLKPTHQTMKGKLTVLLLALAASTRAQPDFSKVEVKAVPVAGNIFMLTGSGGNIGVSLGPDGVLIVDDQFAPLAPKIEAALKELSPGKLKFVINT